MAWYLQYRDKVLELHTAGLSIEEIAKWVGLSDEQASAVLEKIRPKPSSKRSIDMFEMYKSGNTLEEIGKKYGLTRERVRQILQVQVAAEIGIAKWQMKQFKEQISDAMDMFVTNARDSRQEDILKQKLDEAAKKSIKPEYFNNLSTFCKAADVTIGLLKQYRPDIYESLKYVPGRQWSTNYAACRNCGTTTIKHQGMGLCLKCYRKSDYFKAIVSRSYQKNKEARSLQNKRFREEYDKRPEVIEKTARDYDLKFFGGNRKAALERDGYKCVGCGMSTEVKDTAGRSKARVWHLNGDTEDHRLDNLKTYCRGCYIADYGSPFRSDRR